MSKKTGKCPIYVNIAYDGHRIRKSTKHSCLPKDFDAEKNKVKSSDKTSGAINSTLANIQKVLEEYSTVCSLNKSIITEEGVLLTLSKIGLVEAPKGVDTNPKKFVEAINYYQNVKKNIVTLGYLNTYKQLIGHLDLFKKDVLLANCNYDFWVSFINYLYNEAELGQNTVAGHFRKITSVYNFLKERGLVSQNEVEQISIKEIEGEIVYLSIDELRQLENHIPTKNYLDRVKDMFLFQCYTGLRQSDLANLKPSNYIVSKDNTGNTEHLIKFMMIKTTKYCKVPLSNKALEIVQKYIGFNDNSLFPVITQQKYNVYIKELCQEAKLDNDFIKISYQASIRKEEKITKYKVISSHTGRHTFATLFIMQGGNVVALSKLMGHSSLDTTMRYVKITDGMLSNEIAKTLNSL